MFLKLEEMIHTVGMFKTEMIGTRVPKYEQRFIEKRRADQERKRREMRRISRLEKMKQEKMKFSEIMYPSGGRRRVLGDKLSPG